VMQLHMSAEAVFNALCAGEAAASFLPL
jgi:hypothetical protein